MVDFTDDELSLLYQVVLCHGNDEADWCAWMMEQDWPILRDLVERGVVIEHFSDPETELFIFDPEVAKEVKAWHIVQQTIKH